MRKLIILFSVILLIGIIYWWRLPNTVQGRTSDHEFEYIVRTSGSGGSSDTLPMIIALHGHGDTPKKFFNTLLKRFNDPARFIVLRGPIDYPGASLGGRAWPTDSKGLRELGDALADAVFVLEEDYPTAGKPIVIGFSGGAIVAYYLSAFHADKFSYIFPLSGRLSRMDMTPETMSFSDGADIVAFHGTKDQVIGFNHGKAAVEKLKQRGLNAELISFDGGHLGVFMSANELLLEHLGDAVYEIPSF
jgi:phospholipase/carboxylesterase